MIPKVIVWNGTNKEELTSRLNVRLEQTISIQGDEVGIDELRKWINSSVGVANGVINYQLFIWSADSLSFECQSVLLKPLEEVSDNLSFNLVVGNENGLMSTILSRCVVENHQVSEETKDVYWNRVMECWEAGPAKCIELSDTIDKETAKQLADELLIKIKKNLDTNISVKRLAVMEEVLRYAEDAKLRNINIKLATGDFLIRTWQIIKT